MENSCCLQGMVLPQMHSGIPYGIKTTYD